MLKKALLIFSFLLPLIMVAQDVEVINHKGTKIKIANNKVTTATSAPTTPGKKRCNLCLVPTLKERMSYQRPKKIVKTK